MLGITQLESCVRTAKRGLELIVFILPIVWQVSIGYWAPYTLPGTPYPITQRTPHGIPHGVQGRVDCITAYSWQSIARSTIEKTRSTIEVKNDTQAISKPFFRFSSHHARRTRESSISSFRYSPRRARPILSNR